MIALLLVSFFAFLVLRVPIAVALGLSCLLGLAYQPMAPTAIIAQRMFVSIDSFPLMAVPLYMLAGYLMSAGGISRRIVDFSSALVAGLRGGLAQVNIVASMIFGGISGSAVADTAGIGTIMIPAMKAKGFPSSYTAAVTAASSTIGIVIPPSIPMIIIGAMLGVSVGKLFLGGLVPGASIGFALMAVAYAIGRKHARAETDPFSMRKVFLELGKSVWALLMPAIVIVGIVAGVFTPTEAGAVAVVYALFVARFVYRELGFGVLCTTMVKTAESTAKVFFLIATAGLYSWLLTANGFPQMVGGFLTALTSSPRLMLLIIAGILLVVTTFMESIAAMILLLPILYPVAQDVGIDDVHFGLVVVMSIGIGLVTPPVGLCLIVGADIAESDMGAASKSLVPFVAVMIALLALVIFVPALVTAVPNLFME